MCGENAGKSRISVHFTGSSPRVRGKQLADGQTGTARRLIPACAGKTIRPGSNRRRAWAHPRVCGENGRGAGDVYAAEGSSPRVRGKLVFSLLM